jgi:DNA-directed RNA polymerase subunit RPC12/RpoP
MFELKTYSCRTCGAAFQITDAFWRFKCTSCGQEYMLYHSGCLVALPTDDANQRTRVDMDGAAAELEISRLEDETMELIVKGDTLLGQYPHPQLGIGLAARYFGLGFSAVAMYLFYLSWNMYFNNKITPSIAALAGGIGLLCFALLWALAPLMQTAKWKRTTGAQLKLLDDSVAENESEELLLKNLAGN